MRLSLTRARWCLPLILVLIASIALTGCGSNGATGTVTLAGSTTVQPVAEKLAEAFRGPNPSIRVTVQGGGSSVGVTSCYNGIVDIGMVSREMKASEPALVTHLLGRDGIAIITHPGNPVSDLTLEQVKNIFAGEITNWNQIDASAGNHAIVVIAREEGSGTRGAFEEMVMDVPSTDKKVITAGANLFPSNGAIRTAVATTPRSIGFLSFGYLNESVKVMAVDGVLGTPENALKTGEGAYPIVRPILLVTKGEPEGAVKTFLDFCKSSEGQDVVESQGFLRVD